MKFQAWIVSFYLFMCPVLADVAKAAESLSDIGGEDGVFTIGALGDSISTGFNASVPFSNESLSWTTGNNALWLVKSHFRRLKKIFPGSVLRYNTAKVGAGSAGLDAQLTELETALASRELDYLTIMTGANDVCWWPQDHQSYLNDFQKNVRAALDRVISSYPGVKITVVPVPDMMRLYELGMQKKTCAYRWRAVPMCDGLFRAETQEKRDDFRARLQDLNHALETTAKAYPDNVYFAKKVSTAIFEPYDVSAIDCFHPSVTGQQKIADDSWVGGWFDR